MKRNFFNKVSDESVKVIEKVWLELKYYSFYFILANKYFKSSLTSLIKPFQGTTATETRLKKN